MPISGSILDGISCRVPAATRTSSAKAPACWVIPVTVRFRQCEGTFFAQAVHKVFLPYVMQVLLISAVTVVPIQFLSTFSPMLFTFPLNSCSQKWVRGTG